MSNSGISGDMLLAALLGFSSNPNKILKEFTKLNKVLEGVSKIELNLEKIQRSGIGVHQLQIKLNEDKKHRTAKVLKNALIKFFDLVNYSDLAQEYAIKVLDTLIKAEAEVHGTHIENIHLHELSSVDTLIDILGVTKALDELDVFENHFQIFCSHVPLGGGTINTAHGILPVPAPATAKILEGSNLVINGGPIESELVTPTGAALLVNLNPSYMQFPNQIELEKLSYSTGVKSFDNFLNILRIFHGNLVTSGVKLDDYAENLSILETNIDDVSGEVLGNFITTLSSSEKVLDIQVIPSITKKNRPSHIIQVYCHPQYSLELIERIMYELGTLGVRYRLAKRVCIDRKVEEATIDIKNKSYSIGFKISFWRKENKRVLVNIKPEYEDLNKISRESGLSVKQITFYCQQIISDLFNKYKRK
jgi:uncharacterized protein (TIGR00299 family) protein